MITARIDDVRHGGGVAVLRRRQDVLEQAARDTSSCAPRPTLDDELEPGRDQQLAPAPRARRAPPRPR